MKPRPSGSRSWRNWATRCELLADGDVLIVGTRRNGSEVVGYLLRMTWAGQIVWRQDLNAHHDVELTPDGRVLTLTWENRRLPDLDTRKLCQDNLLSLFSAAGEPLESLSLHDLVVAQPRSLPLVRPLKSVDRTLLDYCHANSVSWMPWAGLLGSHPLYAPDNVLVSLRHQDLLAVINWREQAVVWTWGRGELQLPHEASWLPTAT